LLPIFGHKVIYSTVTKFSLARLFKQIPVVNMISTNPEEKVISSLIW